MPAKPFKYLLLSFFALLFTVYVPLRAQQPVNSQGIIASENTEVSEDIYFSDAFIISHPVSVAGPDVQTQAARNLFATEFTNLLVCSAEQMISYADICAVLTCHMWRILFPFHNFW